MKFHQPSRSPGAWRSLRRVAAAVLVVGLTVLAGISPAAADDPDHTIEKFTDNVGPFPAEFGFNPCTGGNDSGLIQFQVKGEIETENGEEHANIAIKGSVQLDNGFVAVFQQEDEANIDASGTGTVNITLEFEIHDPDSGDHFSVHVDVVLTINGGDVVFAQENEIVSDCDRG